MSTEDLERLREKYAASRGSAVHTPDFQKVVEHFFSASGTRSAPYAGVPTFLSLPSYPVDPVAPDFGELEVALLGVPMDLGVTNRSGARFGPRALRAIERIGPYNEAMNCTPAIDLRTADIGDVPLRSRFNLETAHADIEAFYTRIVEAGVLPLSVGGDHSMTYSILRAIGRDRPVGMIHIDAHCDTGAPFDGTKLHHGAPFRNAVLDGVLDPRRSVQIGIRGSSGYLWEFSADSGMTVIEAAEVSRLGIEQVIAQAREVIGNGPTYVTFDIDGLDPAFAPGTGTPEIGGLTTREALELLRGLKGIDIVGGDVVEVAPNYDATTNTAHAAAQMLFEILSLFVFRPRQG